jgi:ketosteroid isomerase-like protein
MSVQYADEAFGNGLRRIRMVVEFLRLSGAESVEEIASLAHPEITVLAVPGIAPGWGYQGREEFLGYFAEARAHGVFVEPDAREIEVGPSGSVLVVGGMRVSSPGGVEETPAWFVYTFRDGLIASVGTYLDREKAEASAGLPVNSGPDTRAGALPQRKRRGVDRRD